MTSRIVNGTPKIVFNIFLQLLDSTRDTTLKIVHGTDKVIHRTLKIFPKDA